MRDSGPLVGRARAAADRIGWADPGEPAALSDATLELARVLTELAWVVVTMGEQLAGDPVPALDVTGGGDAA